MHRDSEYVPNTSPNVPGISENIPKTPPNVPKNSGDWTEGLHSMVKQSISMEITDFFSDLTD